VKDSNADMRYLLSKRTKVTTANVFFAFSTFAQFIFTSNSAVYVGVANILRHRIVYSNGTGFRKQSYLKDIVCHVFKRGGWTSSVVENRPQLKS